MLALRLRFPRVGLESNTWSLNISPRLAERHNDGGICMRPSQNCGRGAACRRRAAKAEGRFRSGALRHFTGPRNRAECGRPGRSNVSADPRVGKCRSARPLTRCCARGRVHSAKQILGFSPRAAPKHTSRRRGATPERLIPQPRAGSSVATRRSSVLPSVRGLQPLSLPTSFSRLH
jgi:hypothetical protein